MALQIEYSLLERTVEGELIPMARELGLGVTPWSPLKSGVLSGKYTRDNPANTNPGVVSASTSGLDEKAYAIVDELARIAKELDSTRVARGARVGARPAWRDVDHHRRADHRAARPEPRRARM